MPERSPPPPDLAGLPFETIATIVAGQPAPALKGWNPPNCGESGITILADGRWMHQGRPITRPAMVRLFATVLRREADGSFALVTPFEKLTVEVEDTPFLAVELASEGDGDRRNLAFRLSTGAVVGCGRDHPLRVEGSLDRPRPLLSVRPGLDARLTQAVWFALAELALAEGADPPALWSGGVSFPLVPAST